MARSASAYSFSRGPLARLFGGIVLIAGVLLLAWTVTGALGAPAWLTTLLLGLLVLAGVAGVVAAVALAVPPTVLRLDDDGYVVRWVRGSGVTRSRWQEMSSVTTRSSPQGPVMVLNRFGSGGQTRVPLAVLDAPVDEIEEEVRRRLRLARRTNQRSQP